MSKYKKYQPLFELGTYDDLHLILEALHPDIDEVVDFILKQISEKLLNPGKLNKLRSLITSRDKYGNFHILYKGKLKDIVPQLKNYDVTLFVKQYEHKTGFSGMFNPEDMSLTIVYDEQNLRRIPITLRHEIVHMLDEIRYNKRASRHLDNYKDIGYPGNFNDKFVKDILAYKAAFQDIEIQAYIHVSISVIEKVYIKKDPVYIEDILERSGFGKIISGASLYIKTRPDESEYFDLSRIARKGTRNFFKRLVREIDQLDIDDKYKKSLLRNIQGYQRLIPDELG